MEEHVICFALNNSSFKSSADEDVAPVLYYIANAGTRHSTHLTHISITCCTFLDQGFSSRFSHLHGILVLLYIWQLLYLLEEKNDRKTPPKQNKNIYLVNWKTFLSWNKKLQMMSEKSLLARCPSGFLNALRLSLHPGGCLPVCTHTLLIWPGTLTSCQTTNQMKLYYSYFLCSSGVKVWIILLTENNDK